MTLDEKMFGRSTQTGKFEGTAVNRNDDSARDLFSENWEVFVIKHDRHSGRFKTFTLCCEAARVINDVHTNAK